MLFSRIKNIKISLSHFKLFVTTFISKMDEIKKVNIKQIKKVKNNLNILNWQKVDFCLR